MNFKSSKKVVEKFLIAFVNFSKNRGNLYPLTDAVGLMYSNYYSGFRKIHRNMIFSEVPWEGYKPQARGHLPWKFPE